MLSEVLKSNQITSFKEQTMRAVIQRVKESSVKVDGEIVGKISRGLTILIGVEEGDTPLDAAYIADKSASLRIFEDANDKMNLSLSDIQGEILAISQFTLAGDARKGKRPSFSHAAKAEEARALYETVVSLLREKGINVETGIFQADMEVSIINDGPVTILLDSRKLF